MRRFTPPLVLLAALALGACDTLTEDPGSASPPASASPKLRHWDLASGGLAPGHAFAGVDSVDFIVTFSDLVSDPEAAAEALFQAQEVVKRDYYRDSFTGVAVTAPADGLNSTLNALIASDSVAYVEPDLPLDPIAEQATYLTLAQIRASGAYGGGEWFSEQLRPWSVKRIEAHSAWTRAGDGQGEVDVDVYVIDGPVEHPDLNVVERRSFLPPGLTPASALHGTHVAGVIGAADDADGLVGVAPGARIHALGVLDAAGSTTLSTLLGAVEYVTAQKRAAPARPLVVNMSIGLDIGTTAFNALDEAVAAAVQAGVVFVVSAGNGAADVATFSPAHVPGAITVGATDPFDNFAGTFSNRGGGVDLLAPGVEVFSLADGGRYALLSGTSMAAPHVAGAAALYLARNAAAMPAAVRDELVRRGKDAGGVPAGTAKRRVKAKDL